MTSGTAGPGEPPVRIVYVAGSARSGSTLLSSLLGSHPDAFMAGELSNFDLSYTRRGTCSCGAPVPDCPIWSAVWRRLHESPGWHEGGGDALRGGRHRDLIALTICPSRSGSAAARMSLGPRLALYRAVSEATGRSVIIDSSKKAVTALAMAEDPRFRLGFVHIVRDPRAVAHSEATSAARWPDIPDWERPQDFSPRTSALAWCVANTAADLVRRGHCRDGVRVRYEDLCEQPVEVLAHVAEAVGLAGISPPVADGQAVIGSGHVINGNPMRFSEGPRPLVDAQSWRSQLSRQDRMTVDALTYPLRRRYGYRS